MASTYIVHVPVTGIIYAEIEAESEEEATDIALAQEYDSSDIKEFETHSVIVEGRVFYGVLNRIDVDPVQE